MIQCYIYNHPRYFYMKNQFPTFRYDMFIREKNGGGSLCSPTYMYLTATIAYTKLS